MAITYGQNSTNEFSHKNNEGVLQEAVDGPNIPQKVFGIRRKNFYSVNFLN